MTIEEAKVILQIHHNDDAQDRYEEEIFKLVQVFLKDPVIPSLAENRIRKILQLSEAFQLLAPSDEKNAALPELPLLNIRPEWRAFFHEYEMGKAVLRGEIARTYAAKPLMELIHKLIDLEKQYAGIFIRYTNKIATDETAKVSEAVPIPEILKECENLQAKRVIDSHLQSFENINGNLSIFNLSKEVNRLRKITKNG